MRAERYEQAARVLLAETGCTVRAWRTSNTGIAYTKADDWGIEAPRPRGPVSFSVFAHEIGHQLRHRNNSTPRWLEEIEAWEYALDQFNRFRLDGQQAAQQKAAKAVAYAVHEASRRCAPRTAQRILARVPGWATSHPHPVWHTLRETGDN